MSADIDKNSSPGWKRKNTYEHNRLRTLPQKVRPPEVDALGWPEWIPQVSALRQMHWNRKGKAGNESTGESMSTFEFDDVINTAKVIVNPEASAAELKRLREGDYRLTQKLAQAQVKLEAKDAELAKARKVIDIIDNLHPDFPVITDFLATYPEPKRPTDLPLPFL
jgi:hypothetical protein